MKRSLCPHCRKRLSDGERIHPECVEPWAEAQADKADRKRAKAIKTADKAERALDKAKRESMKGLNEWIADAQWHFNRFIRHRDREAGVRCISSGAHLNWWKPNSIDAGHYRSRGAAGHLRYNEDNCHSQTKEQNRFKAGNAVDYRINLIKRIGIDRVEALESDNKPHKWTIEELKEIKEKYKKKWQEIEKRNSW